MQINGTSHIHGSHAIRGPQRLSAPAAQQAAPSLAATDRVDLSAEAEMISRMGDLPDIRADRVAEIRQQIAAGVYETREKLDVAVGRLFDELAG